MNGMINEIPLLVLIPLVLTILAGVALVVIKEVIQRQYRTPAYALWAAALMIAFGGLFAGDAVVGIMCILVGALFVVASIPLKRVVEYIGRKFD